MHVVQLLLEIVDLFFQSGLPVELFLIVLLGRLGLLGYLGDLHEFIDRLCDQSAAFLSGIRRKNGVFFLRAQIQIFCKSAGQIIDVFALQYEASRPQSPLIALNELQQGGAQAAEKLLFLLGGQIRLFGADGCGGGQHAVLNLDIGNIHSLHGPHLDVVTLADALHTGGYADGIEGIRRKRSLFPFLLQLDEQDIRSHLDGLGAPVGEKVLLKIVGYIR